MKKQKFVILSVFVLAIVFACAFLIPKTQASTTVGADINTGGSLTVTGNILQGANSAIYQNDLQVFVASSTARFVVAGTEAGKNLNNAGTKNVFLGYRAGYTATSSYSNIGIGDSSLYSLVNNGSWNIGAYNIGIGENALYGTTIGWYNIGIGYHALTALTTASNNIAIGGNSPLASLVSGTYNLAIGDETLGANVSGTNNVAIGYMSYVNNTGSYNIGLGVSTGGNSTTGNNNTAIGDGALYSFTEGSWNTAVGAGALYRNSTKSFANTALGYQAGYGGSGSTHASSTWVGYQAGLAVTSGSSNVALGYKAADNLTTGSNNIVIGYDIDAPAASSNYTLNIGNILFGDSINGTGTTIRGRIGIATSTPWRTASEDYGFVVATTTFLTARATTTSDFVIGTETTAATTTLKIKADATAGNGSSCIEMKDVEGTSYVLFVNAGTLKIEAGTCK